MADNFDKDFSGLFRAKELSAGLVLAYLGIADDTGAILGIDGSPVVVKVETMPAATVIRGETGTLNAIYSIPSFDGEQAISATVPWNLPINKATTAAVVALLIGRFHGTVALMACSPSKEGIE